MAIKYIDSVTGNDADDGSTWALAKATLNAACTVAAAGDRIWIENGSAETAGSTKTITMPGTIASPTQILCGDSAAEPPTALSTGAQVITTGNFGITINGSGYVYGVSFRAGTGAVSQGPQFGNNGTKQVYENCDFQSPGTGANGFVQAGIHSTGTNDVEMINCTMQFGATTQRFYEKGRVRIRGGSVVAGSQVASFFTPTSASTATDLVVDGFDFSAMGSTMNLVVGGACTQSGKAVFRNCKLPASWTGLLVSTAFTNPGLRAEMWNCSSADEEFYRMRVEDYAGSCRDETTIVRTGGATFNSQQLSWLIAGSSNLSASGLTTSEWGTHVFRSPEIFVQNTTTGTRTLRVEFVQNHASSPPTGLQDDEIWMEVQYQGTSGTPLSLFADNAVADIMGTPATHATSSETWAGTTSATKQYLEKAVTVNEVGTFIVTICVAITAIAATGLYVCPKVTVS